MQLEVCKWNCIPDVHGSTKISAEALLFITNLLWIFYTSIVLIVRTYRFPKEANIC